MVSEVSLVITAVSAVAVGVSMLVYGYYIAHQLLVECKGAGCAPVPRKSKLKWLIEVLEDDI